MAASDDDHDDDVKRPSGDRASGKGDADKGDAEKDEGDGSGGDGDDADDGDSADDKPSPLSNPKVRIGLIVAGVVAVVVLVAWFLHYRSYGRFQQSTNDAYLAADQVNVAPRVSGYVERVLVGDNQIVRPGQLLVRIEAQDYDATANQSRAQVAQAQASVAQAQAQRRQQYDMIRQNLAQAAQSRATIRQYEATARFDADEVARYAPLSAAGAETREKLAQYVSERDAARAQADAARAQTAASAAQVASARHQLAYYDAQIRSGRAQVDAARAQLAANLVNVRATTIASRIGGRIGDRTVRVGQYVQAGTRLMTVVPVDALYLTANFKETQIGLMRVGQPATIKVDALAGEDIHGVVESFSPGTGSRFALVPTDNATGNFTKIVQRVPVRIRVDAGARARQVLVPGLSALVSVDTRSAREDAHAQHEEEAHSERSRERRRAQELERNRTHPRIGAGK